MKELAQLKQGRSPEPVVIGRTGEMSNRDITKLTEKDYIMGRKLAQMSPEERVKAKQQRDTERIA